MTKTDDDTLKVLKDSVKELEVYHKALTLFQEIGLTLQSDLIAAQSIQAGQEEQDIAKRTTLRAYFAWVEATLFALKTLALGMSEHKALFSEEELAMLREHVYDLDEKGQARIQTKFIPLAKNLRFTFDTCSRAFGACNPLDVGVADWDSFKKALEMRNRITHPRTVEDLHISAEDSAQIDLAATWYAENLTRLINQHGARLEELGKQINSASKNPLHQPS